MDIQSTHPGFDPTPTWERNKGGACFTSVSLPNVLTTDGPAKALRPRLGESRYEVHCTDLFPIATLKFGLKNGGYVQYQMETSRKGAVSLVFQGFGVRGGWDLSRTWHTDREFVLGVDGCAEVWVCIWHLGCEVGGGGVSWLVSPETPSAALAVPSRMSPSPQYRHV